MAPPLHLGSSIPGQPPFFPFEGQLRRGAQSEERGWPEVPSLIHSGSPCHTQTWGEAGTCLGALSTPGDWAAGHPQQLL